MVNLLNILIGYWGIMGIFFLIIFLYPLIKYLSYRNRYKRYRFKIYALVGYIIGLLIISILSMIFKVSPKYTLTYMFSYLLVFGFIQLSKNIKNNCKGNLRITEYQFFIYVSQLIGILILSILLFSFFYFNSTPLDKGYFIKEEVIQSKTIKIVQILNLEESILFSGFTFFSMEYDNILTQGLLRWISLIELFTAQMMIIIFIGIMAGELFKKLKLIES